MPSPRRLPAAPLLSAIALGAACGGGEPATATPAPRPPPEGAPSVSAGEGEAPPRPAPHPPVDPALPSNLDVPPLRATQTCWPGKHVCCPIEPPEAALFPGSPVALWEVSLEKGACVQGRPDEEIEVFGVLLEGSAGLRCEGGACPPLERSYAAFRVPGGGLRIIARGPTRIVFGMARAGGLPLSGWDSGKPAGQPKRAPEVFSFAGRPDLAWGGGAFHARIGWEPDASSPETGGAPAVLSTLRFSGRAGVAEHDHPASWECIVVLEGGGELARRKKGEAARREMLGPGDVVCVAPGERHAFTGTADGPFTALQVYAPPGPEQRFKALAAKAAPWEAPR